MLTCYVCKDKFYLNLLQINTQLCLKEWQENSWRKKLKKIWAMAVFPNNKVDCNMVSVNAQQLSGIVRTNNGETHRITGGNIQITIQQTTETEQCQCR